jgi:dTMP kinase
MSNVTPKDHIYRCRLGQGILIAAEGLDGAGKTTHARYLSTYLNESMRWSTYLTREPGGTEFAVKSRDLMFADITKETSDTTQALLITAARRDHVEKVIMPKLIQGHCVITDRFTLSTRMYQREADNLEQLIEIGSCGLKPHVTLIFDVDYEVAAERMRLRDEQSGQKSNWLDKISHAEFLARKAVLEEYVAKNPLSTFVINANKPLSDVQSAVHQWMSRTLLPLISPRLMTPMEEAMLRQVKA